MRTTTRALALSILLLAATAAPAGAALKGCDDLDPSVCLLPFPSDAYTSPAATPTGKHVDFPQMAMPRNAAGLPVDPTEWNRNDGFSPGSMAITFVPGLDLHRTFGTTRELIEDPALTVRRSRKGRLLSPILLIDTGPADAPTQPTVRAVFAELDRHPKTRGDQRLLLVRPLRNLLEGHRYVVVLRDLRNGRGDRIAAGAAFTRLRDRTAGVDEGARIEHYERDVFPLLKTLGVARDASLFLAWDFTVASERNLSGRALAIRDDAFAKLGDRDLADGRIQGRAPSFKVVSVTTAKDGTRTITGTVAVPNYLTLPDQLETPPVPDPTGMLTDVPPQVPPGDRFHYASDAPGPMETPIQNPDAPMRDVEWVCTLPPTARPDRPATPTLYGHGLLGSKGESQGGSTARDRERNFMPCATDWIGFSSHDLANVVVTLTDFSTFGGVIDRAQQGFLNFMYLGRALKAVDGFATDKAFRSADGKPLIATGQLVYDGNSQAGSWAAR